MFPLEMSYSEVHFSKVGQVQIILLTVYISTQCTVKFSEITRYVRSKVGVSILTKILVTTDFVKLI